MFTNPCLQQEMGSDPLKIIFLDTFSYHFVDVSVSWLIYTETSLIQFLVCVLLSEDLLCNPIWKVSCFQHFCFTLWHLQTKGNQIFWIVFIVIYVGCILMLTVLVYYVGRWRVCK